ncbi:putative helicase SWR1 [Lyophyllum shimeji]|uniref:DNA helicase n=1 Tax=Lyophyllum shimeji TaxID=47721 RepID=A0A9P3PKX7_LYOSH|nr:putative helicase SWR1 [Lyophyllum shimeji]
MPANGLRSGREQEARGRVQEGRGVAAAAYGKGGVKSKQKGVKGVKSGVMVTEGMLEAERADLIARKQAQLEAVVDSHDTLVREMFHMDKFTNMLQYDPAVAKTDDTKVFRDYKAMYDLFDMAVSGPSRATRRSRQEQAHLLKNAFISAPLPTVTPSPAKKKQIKRRKTAANGLDSNKAKGKADHVSESRDARASVFNDETPEGIPPESISAVLVHRNPPEKDDDEIERISPPAKRRKLSSTGVQDSISPASRRSGRLTRPVVNVNVDVPSTESTGNTDQHVTQSATALPPPIKRRKVRVNEPPLVTISAPPAPPKFNIKRVKLIIRKPPPPITNPRQRPPPAQHNYSVNNFLSSYVTLNDEDVDEDALQRQVQTDAEILERVERCRNKGFLFLDPEPGIGHNIQASLPAQRNKRDHWDHVIENACQLRQVWIKRTSGQQLAGQIAKLVRAYWDGQEAKKEKLRIQEERRLRALAKATIRMVTDEWKKAVFHIREQERLKLEAEELRRGREHLDAILDQSGQLLETQQGDLTRGDLSQSRSRSASLSFGGWGSEDDDDTDEDEDEEDVDDAGDQDEDDDDDDQEMDTEEDEDTHPLQRDGAGPSSSPTHLDVDDSSDMEEDTNTRMLLGNPDVSSAPASVHSSIFEDPAETEISRPSVDADAADEDVQSEPSYVLEVNELMNAAQDRSPQCPPHPPPFIDSNTATDEHLVTPKSQPLSLPRLYSSEAVVSGVSPSSQTPVPSHQSTPHTRDNVCSEDESQAGLQHDAPASSPRSTSPAPSSSDAVSGPSPEHSPPEFPSHPSILDSDATEISPRDGKSVEDAVPSKLEPAGSANDAAPRGPSASPRSLPWNVEDNEEHAETSAEPVTDLTQQHEESSQGVGVEPSSIPESREQEDAIFVPAYLKPFAVAPVQWDPGAKIVPPLLLRGVLRPYQQSGLEWLASLHMNNLNGILADEMGLGKTIQTIALLAHLACDRGIWGPHLIVVPTSVLLNWEMEFKKFLPGFRVLSYHGSTKRRKELRQGWNDRHHFNVCITSYTLASRDAHIFKRKAWYYMILDEAHMIKNFKSQRWNILLMFRSWRRLLLTGTPLQNNLTELWALLQFLMSGANFASLKDFGDWFSNPLEKAIEMGNTNDDETQQRVSKLHTVLRPYLLRRLKRDVEKELPSKHEHLVLCPLSKRQRFLYDEFMSRAHTRAALQSGIYQKIANILMQLRKVCNHPDLFEVRPIVTSFAMERSASADFEIKELLIRRLLQSADDGVNLGVLGLQFIDNQNSSIISALETRRLDATSLLPMISESPGEPPPKDNRTIAGFRKYAAYMQRASTIARWSHIGYLNRLRCSTRPIYSSELLTLATRFHQPILPISSFHTGRPDWEAVRVVNAMVKSYETRAEEMEDVIDRFAFVTPAVVALDLPRFTFSGREAPLVAQPATFDNVLHKASVKLQIAFPDPSLLQYDCGKLQVLTRLLREKKAGGHRVLIFTQMTKILDILEIYLNFHGYLYLRLDGATKIEDRQYITERFNANPRIFCFIASSRSGGVGINLTGADTVIFYDSDFNPQMDRQCEDRAHRIGQIRDVHIYRFVSQHTVEEALLRKANQKRSLDDLVIQKGEFDWRSLFKDESALSKALEEFEDTEDVHAAAVAATEEVVMQGADEADFGGDMGEAISAIQEASEEGSGSLPSNIGETVPEDEPEVEEEEGGSVVDYMLAMVQRDYEFFREWRL